MTIHIQEAGAHAKPILRKVSASLPDRAAAKKAVRTLRRAGYPSRSIQVLHGPPRATEKQVDFHSIFSKFLRHLGSSSQVMIGVTHYDIDTATRIFHEMGVEMAVNRYFHQNIGSPRLRRDEASCALPTRIWME